jgi:hypothetical protein
MTIIALSIVVLFSGCRSPLESKCRELGRDEAEKSKKNFPQDYLFLKADTFYSKVLNSCIHTEVPEAQAPAAFVLYRIQDLSHSLLKDPNLSLLLYCDKDGADSVVVDKVHAYSGYVYTVAYSEWLDNGFGGPPRTVKTPNQPYTKNDCERVFQKWMNFLK